MVAPVTACGPAVPAPYVYDVAPISALTELVFDFRLPFASYVWLSVRLAMLLSLVVAVLSRPSGS